MHQCTYIRVRWTVYQCTENLFDKTHVPSQFLNIVNGEYITACNHDDAVNILRNAGDLVVLTVKHYRAAKPFLQKNGNYLNSPMLSSIDVCTITRITLKSSNCWDTEKEEKLDNCANGETEEEWVSPNRRSDGSPKSGHSRHGSNTSSSSANLKKWVDVITG